MKKLGLAVLTAATIAGTGMAFKNFVNPYETVYKIADGDTFILENNKQTIRLFGIDAPEMNNCYGPESYARLDTLLKKRKVQLKEPVVDKFGRIVALVYVDGKLINETMIKEGYAAYRSEPGSGKEAMKAAHEIAKTNKIGIYSKICTDEVPPDPKCAIKGNHDLDRDEYLYLTPECPYYSLVTIRRFEGDQWFCNPSDAQKAGFKLSSACGLGTNRTLLPK
ncbi:MAG: Thermonuclease family protein [Candidatus Amesbacteria bacterium GW2011_GWA2_42_12]|uniref:Thermonuclease family protein n=1 Tax=Candidatus Amesbacteria bacterium GW2011_GWA2_42_12 TaxID=1618356 RepID=A0A0G0Y982_9BACT|nr:MAG: Thermonuclease family protein [Candidatus Amesbacteria bacterium GW2011_GWA2_42_12]